MSQQPIYQHDCTDCVFLGNFTTEDSAMGDLYVCSQIGNIPTVIFRHENDGPQYQSGLPYGGDPTEVGIHALDWQVEAIKRTKQAGHFLMYDYLYKRWRFMKIEREVV